MVTKQGSRKKIRNKNVNIFSKLFYWWPACLWYKGTIRDLESEDLYEPVHFECSGLLGDQLEKEWKEELTKSKMYQTTKKKKSNEHKPSLLRCFTRIYLWTFLFQGVLMFVYNIICLNLRTIFLGRLIAYFDIGLAVEFDHPYNLLKIPDGHFAKMVAETSNMMAAKLTTASL